MRTFFYQPLVFVGLLVVCLMFAPSRQIIGDVQVSGQPSPLNVVPKEVPAKPFADLCRDDPVGALAASLSKYKGIEAYTSLKSVTVKLA